jgi:hypothetical protein
MAAMRREPVFGAGLSYWDEAAVYGFIGHRVFLLS